MRTYVRDEPGVAIRQVSRRWKPRVDLREALEILPLIASQEPDSFERAACKWLARLALERDVGLEEVGIAFDALDRLDTAPEHARTVLGELERSARPLPTRRSTV